MGRCDSTAFWRARVVTFIVLSLAVVSRAGASATLLLEEPYGKLGFFTSTGHTAVYLSNVCAETALLLRPCMPDEPGVVLSRYNGVGDHDWIAIPLIPYLYAVEGAEDVPLFADAKMVAFLRDRYRRKYLEAIAPDGKNGEIPGGNWYELVGSSYDRTIFGFEVETTPEQDAAFIRKYNSSANGSHFNTVSHNCADFAKGVINFYYPKALHRSVVADLGITTPKQLAKRLVKFAERHPEVQLSRIVIPQIPGAMARSTAVHGVVESFFKSKKYIVPSAVVSPIFAGCVAAVYVGTRGGRFDPAHDALVFNASGEPGTPMGREDWRAYRLELKHLLAANGAQGSGSRVEKNWRQLQARAVTEIDEEGRPVLKVHVGNQTLSVGATASNVLTSGTPPELVQALLLARLQTELRQKESRPLSETEIARDWDLLQQVLNETAGRDIPQLSANSDHIVPVGPLRPERAGNRP